MTTVNLGKCCMCRDREAMTIIAHEFAAPVRGEGWGCMICNLPPDGAVSVLCNDCILRIQMEKIEIPDVCEGFPYLNKRIPLSDYKKTAEKFIHDLNRHAAGRIPLDKLKN